jgi:hypothetical protein
LDAAVWRTLTMARDKAVGILGKMGLANVADDLVSDLPSSAPLVGDARALMGDAKCLLLVSQWPASRGRPVRRYGEWC